MFHKLYQRQYRKQINLVLILLLVAVLFYIHQSGFIDNSCLPRLPLIKGWLGGDNIVSVPLGKDKTLWLFGESFVKSHHANKVNRDKARLIANSVGIGTCERLGGYRMHYYWGDSKAAYAPFQSPIQDSALLPRAGIRVGKQVTLLFAAIKPLKTKALFHYRTIATVIAQIDNTDGSPLNWHPKVVALTQTAGLNPVAIHIEGDWLYLLMTRTEKQPMHPLLLARVALHTLKDAMPPLFYLGKKGQWQRSAAKAKILLANASNSLSLTYDKPRKEWDIVFSQPDNLNDGVMLSRASTLTGTWSKPETIYHYPQMTPGNRLYLKDAVCYDAKLHPGITRLDGVVPLIYTCRPAHYAELKSLRYYSPQIVPLRFAAD